MSPVTAASFILRPFHEARETDIPQRVPSSKLFSDRNGSRPRLLDQCDESYYNSHKDFPKSGDTLGQTRASAAHDSEIIYESRYSKHHLPLAMIILPFLILVKNVAL
jgi:hypothetical protein